MFDTLYTSEL